VAEVEALLGLATHLARAAGGIQRDRYETSLDVGTKSSAIDLVTEVDRACEALVVETLERERPRDAILAEEGGGRGREDATYRWVVDPLDGTVNFAHGYPAFCVSIGLEREGERVLGVVYEPLRDELFHATRGGGAFRNGRRIQVSSAGALGEALVATGFAYDVREALEDNLDHFARVAKRAQGIRRGGAAALDLGYVACGRLDGYWELKLHPWDVAAGILLVEEAGGRVSDFRGGPPPSSGAEILATNGRFHDAMRRVLAREPES